MSVADVRRQAEEAPRSSHEELSRFNRAAVGRELRMIKLKKEINELCDRLGQPPRYPLEFEKETKRLMPTEATNHLLDGLVKLLTERPMECSPKEDAFRRSQTNGCRTILVVEDEANMLRLLERVL